MKANMVKELQSTDVTGRIRRVLDRISKDIHMKL